MLDISKDITTVYGRCAIAHDFTVNEVIAKLTFTKTRHKSDNGVKICETKLGHPMELE